MSAPTVSDHEATRRLIFEHDVDTALKSIRSRLLAVDRNITSAIARAHVALADIRDEIGALIEEEGYRRAAVRELRERAGEGRGDC
jgi:hypothetical protein